MYKFFIMVGKQIFGTNSKNIAADLARQGGKRIPKNKIPSGTTVKKAPTSPNPQSPSTGQFRPKQPPATTTPKNPAIVRPKPKAKLPVKPRTTAPSKPSGTGAGNTSGAPNRPMKDITPKRTAPDRPKIVGVNPKAFRAPNLKAGTLDTFKPEVIVKEEDKKKTGTTPKRTPPSSMPIPKKTTPKKTTPPKKTTRPKQRPAAGPVTNESFGAAFKRNRKSGKPTFTWKGEKYTTRFKEETITQHKKKFGVEGKY